MKLDEIRKKVDILISNPDILAINATIWGLTVTNEEIKFLLDKIEKIKEIASHASAYNAFVKEILEEIEKE